ncbi:MAG TPA: glycosyltransferase family 2 protein [Spirochaetota bacterium]|nr:glycosyltransferase family 2 protein [Spirochaetota bacterium]
MNITILVPIYNEAENLRQLVEEIFSVCQGCTAVFIDDNSSDNTANILADLSRSFPIRHYVRKNERGYGSALKHGFELVKDADIIITMDGDRSHDPKTIPAMIKAISEDGYDITIGSRYVKGGVILDWPLFRRIISALTNFAVRISLSTGIRDNTSGFRAYSGYAVRTFLSNIRSSGYYVLEEILFISTNRGLQIFEVPIVFADRKEGISKAKIFKEAIGLIKMVVRLRMNLIEKFIKFIIVGLTGIMVNEGLLYCITDLYGVHFQISSIIAIEASIISNFILNDLWTFRENRDGNYFFRLFKFNIARSITGFLNYFILIFLAWLGMSYLIANLIGIGVSTLLGFGLSMEWVWKIREKSLQ